MTYCCHIKAECPKREQREGDTPENYGCPDWWEYSVERSELKDGKFVPTGDVERKFLCGRTKEAQMPLIQDLIATSTKALGEAVSTREELDVGMKQFAMEQRQGFVAVANGIRGHLEKLNGERPNLILPP